MAQKDITSIFTKFGLLALIVFGLLSIVIITQSTNDAPQKLINDARFNDTFISLNKSLSTLEETSDTQWNSFKSETPLAGFASIVMFTIVNIGKTFGTVIFAIFSVIIKLPVLILGITPTVTSMLLAWLTISVVVALWILYKLGG